MIWSRLLSDAPKGCWSRALDSELTLTVFLVFVSSEVADQPPPANADILWDGYGSYDLLEPRSEAHVAVMIEMIVHSKTTIQPANPAQRFSWFLQMLFERSWLITKCRFYLNMALRWFHTSVGVDGLKLESSGCDSQATVAAAGDRMVPDFPEKVATCFVLAADVDLGSRELRPLGRVQAKFFVPTAEHLIVRTS